MKRLPVIGLIVIGLALGWTLAAHSTPAPADKNPTPTSNRGDQIQKARQQKLLSSMLDDYEQRSLAHHKATTSLAVVGALKDTFNYGSDDISRIVDLGPESALHHLLSDPGANDSFCLDLAEEWARHDPAKALRFFRNQNSFRAADCLAATIPFAFARHSDLVIETIRSQTENWQWCHLKDLITAEYSTDQSSPSQLPSRRESDPFDTAPDPEITTPLGPEIINAFKNQELQDRAQEYLQPPPPDSSPDEPETGEAKPPLDLATYNNSSLEQRWAFRARWQENRDELMAEIIEHGSYQARSLAMQSLLNHFPMKQDEWPEALQKLENDMEKLQVIPPRPPSHFDMGPFLSGEFSAEWIARQPLALQRAWTPTFVETWSRSEPAKALRWTLTTPDSPHRNIALQGGLIIWAHQEPQAAILFVEDLPPGDLRDSAISNAVAAWSRIDPDQARNWLNSLPESPAKKRALARIETK